MLEIKVNSKTPEELKEYFKKKYESKPEYKQTETNNRIDFLLDEICNNAHAFIRAIISSLDVIASKQNSLLVLHSFYEENPQLFEYFKVFQELISDFNSGLDIEYSGDTISKKRQKSDDNIIITQNLIEFTKAMLTIYKNMVHIIYSNIKSNTQNPIQLIPLFETFNKLDYLPLQFDFLNKENNIYLNLISSAKKLQEKILADLSQDQELQRLINKTKAVFLELKKSHSTLTFSDHLINLMGLVTDEAKNSRRITQLMVKSLETEGKSLSVLQQFLETYNIEDWQIKSEILNEIKGEINQLEFANETGDKISRLELQRSKGLQLVNQRIETIKSCIQSLSFVTQFYNAFLDNSITDANTAFSNLDANLKSSKIADKYEDNPSDEQDLVNAIQLLTSKILDEHTKNNVAVPTNC